MRPLPVSIPSLCTLWLLSFVVLDGCDSTEIMETKIETVGSPQECPESDASFPSGLNIILELYRLAPDAPDDYSVCYSCLEDESYCEVVDVICRVPGGMARGPVGDSPRLRSRRPLYPVEGRPCAARVLLPSGERCRAS